MDYMQHALLNELSPELLQQINTYESVFYLYAEFINSFKLFIFDYQDAQNVLTQYAQIMEAVSQGQTPKWKDLTTEINEAFKANII
jgi:hypothetical protein